MLCVQYKSHYYPTNSYRATSEVTINVQPQLILIDSAVNMASFFKWR